MTGNGERGKCCGMRDSSADSSPLNNACKPQSAPSSPPHSSPPRIPSHAELFWAFFKIAISGFGGALPWTRRMFVEQKGWMTPQEFNDAYALCQFLPGPNIVNLAAVFGARMRGATGALAAWLGFLGPPFVIMSTIGVLYGRYGDTEVLRKILGGLAAAAAGLMIATFVRMAEPLFRPPVREAQDNTAGRLKPPAHSRSEPAGAAARIGSVFSSAGLGVLLTPAPLVMAAVVIAIGIFRWPLLWVMAAIVPTSILLTWWRR